MAITISGTTGISGVDGSAGTPAVQGTDTNTGVFYPAADTVGVSTGGSERMRIDSSGNVGIGTSSPADNLHVYVNTTTENGIRVQNANASGQSAVQYINNAGTQKADVWWNNNGSTFNIRTLSTDPMIFSTNNTERMRFDSSGHLLVGTTSSDGTAVGIRLFNNNQVQASKSGDWSFRMGRRDSTGIVTEIYYNSTRVGDIATNGTGTTYNSASDYRLKENVQPMVGALERVALLKPCTYTWKINGSTGEGFIAHELQEIVPDAVNGIKDAVDNEGNIVPQSIDTSFLVATLTAAIQEQQALITALTARIEALEAK